MKIKIRIDDPQTRAVWEAALKAKAEVAGWPAWKRGEQSTTVATSVDNARVALKPGRSEE